MATLEELRSGPHKWHSLEDVFSEHALQLSIETFSRSLEESTEERKRQIEENLAKAIFSVVAETVAGSSANYEGEKNATITAPFYTSNLTYKPNTSGRFDEEIYFPAGEADANMGLSFMLTSPSDIDILGNPFWESVSLGKAYGYALILKPTQSSNDNNLYASVSMAERWPTAREILDNLDFMKSSESGAFSEYNSMLRESLEARAEYDEQPDPFRVHYNEFRQFSPGSVDEFFSYLGSDYHERRPDADNLFARRIHVPASYGAIKDIGVMLLDIESSKAELVDFLKITEA